MYGVAVWDQETALVLLLQEPLPLLVWVLMDVLLLRV